MHIRLCNSINNRLSIGGLTLYCTSNNRNIVQSTLWRRMIETCLHSLKIVCYLKSYPQDNITVQSRQIIICQVKKSITIEKISFIDSYNEFKLTLKG